VVGGLLLAGTARARPSNCSRVRQTVACSFRYTGGEQSFVVPSGISGVSVVAVGGAGGDGESGGVPGGLGGTARASLSLTPGVTLYVEVGGAGQSGFDGGGAGGFNGGGEPADNVAAAGGGATDVRTVSCSSSGCPGGSPGLASRLIVAAGGGGGAGYSGGAGGAAGSAGGDGSDFPGIGTGGGGGRPGTALAGGSGGAPGQPDPSDFHSFGGSPGAPGVLGSGGDGGQDNGGGGGGGGGYYGGGGGGGGADDYGVDGQGGGSGGGGGGSSWVEPGAADPRTGIASSGQPASVTISYTVPAAPTCTVTQTVMGPPARQTVTVHASGGLASVTGIAVINGTVASPAFTPGTTGPVPVTATKTNQSKKTVWSFSATDEEGDTTYCR
jgi:hypothetical protein